jgi:DeoR/GlpR family transcriptional regulator of sugar metabolism
MFKESRQRIIQELIDRHNQVSVKNLADRFGVSRMTIRRDLQDLHLENRVERTHGGAITINRPSRILEPRLLDRVNIQAEEKIAIATYVAEQIKSGTTIYLSAGTTVFYIAQALRFRKDINIITNSLVIAAYLAENSDIKVGVLGGYLRRNEAVLYGLPEVNNLKNFDIDQVIIGCRGVHPIYGITSDIQRDVSSDLGIVKYFGRITVVTDHTKIGHAALNQLAPIDQNIYLITSTLASAPVVDALRELNARVDLVPYTTSDESSVDQLHLVNK